MYAISEYAQTLVPKPPLSRERNVAWQEEGPELDYNIIYDIFRNSIASFPSQLADRHMNLQFMRLFVTKSIAS